MAAAGMGEQAKQIAADCESQLAYIWADANIPMDIQVNMVELGLNSTTRFANIEEERAKFRAVMEKELRLEANFKNKMLLADLIGAWEASRHNQRAEQQVKAAVKA